MSLETLEVKMEEIKKILLGNGSIGLCAKVQMLWEGKKTRMGLVDWIYRLIIGIGITYIAVKAGLK